MFSSSSPQMCMSTACSLSSLCLLLVSTINLQFLISFSLCFLPFSVPSQGIFGFCCRHLHPISIDEWAFHLALSWRKLASILIRISTLWVVVFEVILPTLLLLSCHPPWTLCLVFSPPAVTSCCWFCIFYHRCCHWILDFWVFIFWAGAVDFVG